MSEAYSTIRANLNEVERRIAWACARVGRNWREVTLVAVTKERTLGEIIAAYQCGLRHFGENRIEEAEGKLVHLRPAFQQDPPTWHMIGHVQSRKARPVAEVMDIVHSVDSLRLATRLDRFAGELGKRLPVLLELNVSGEPTKAGYPAWDEATLEAFLRQEVAPLAQLAHLEVRGLMTVAPIVPEPEGARPFFRRLREIRDLLRREHPFSPWDHLSMGMTDDFEVAIEEGATMVRIGRAIFGPRPSEQKPLEEGSER
ncbi:MAG: YggS family pyridoxal phosphate-dependent enzyme [Chloroflexi bacterium]|nr:YggS family pyridoxal phosphate-dependent enzyme [Chloroflexota bacterium]